MINEQVLAKIQKLLVDNGMGVDAHPETIIRDTDMNSLNYIEMLIAIEDEWGIEITNDEAYKLKTFQDVADLIQWKAGG